MTARTNRHRLTLLQAAAVVVALLAAERTTALAQEPAARTASPAGAVQIVLFSDFQCPFCAGLAKPFRELQTHGVDGVPIVVTFKHFPLNMHSRAPLAHQAALAAGEQGKFWEMHDLLFANQQKAQRDDFVRYAAQLGLDAGRFRADLDDERLTHQIQSDQAEGVQRHITGTPTFYVNGSSYVGVRTLDQLKTIVVGERQRARALVEVGETLMSSGPVDAAVTLELFADLQSPLTTPALNVAKAIRQRYPSAVRLQFRNFPLAFHPQAALAHEAAMAAARDGRFWEFAAAVLDHQGALSRQDLIALAGRVGLDEQRFADAIHDHRYAARVDADLAAAARSEIRGSPVLLVNGRRIDGVPDLQTVAGYVEAELTKQTKRPPS
jgi:protein-disulfide isomerase